MSNIIEIYANDTKLVLYENEADRFYITQLIHDLRDLQTRNASFTSQVTIPAVISNIVALGPQFSVLNIGGLGGERRIPAKIRLADVEIMSQGYLIVNEVEGVYDKINLQVYFGNFNFFEVIRTINLRDLDWSQYNMNWDLAGVTAIAQETEGIVFARAEWPDMESIEEMGFDQPAGMRSKTDTFVSGFFLYCRTVLEMIVERAGYILDDDAVSWDRWKTSAICCPVDHFLETEPPVDPIEGLVTKNADELQDRTDQEATISFQVENIVDNVTWTGANAYGWQIIASTIPKTVTVTSNLSITTNIKNPPTTAYVALYRNGVIVDQVLLPSSTTQTVVLEFHGPVNTGDVFQTKGYAPNGNGSKGASIAIHAGSDFEIKETGSGTGVGITVRDYIPDMTAQDFLLSFCNMGNVIISNQLNALVVEFINFDHVLTDEMQDWSDKLILNKTIISSNIIDTYFQHNWFKYQGEGYLRRVDADRDYQINNEGLEYEGTKVQLKFDASDNDFWNNTSANSGFYKQERHAKGTITVNAGSSAFIFNDDEDFGVGDYLEVRKSGSSTVEIRRITVKTDNRTGTVAGVWGFSDTISEGVFVHEMSYGENTHRVADIFQTAGNWSVVEGDFQDINTVSMFNARFDDEMTFSYFVDNHYAGLLGALKVPLVITAYFYFTPIEYINIKITKLAYINYFSDKFYINKIDKYKFGKPVRVELIRATH